jgi:acyl-CoA reductase-like NAD-dependent aldehyde dehydrogenase
VPAPGRLILPPETAHPDVIEEHSNSIGGEWRPSRSEHVFEVLPAGGRGVAIARFPRSSARDFEEAISASSAAESSWQRVSPEKRRDLVERAFDALRADPDPENLVARSLGLDHEEMSAHRSMLEGIRGLAGLSGIARASDRELWRARYAAPSGVHVVQVHWSELWIGAALEVFGALLEGRAVLWISDPDVPFLAERVVRALESCGLPRGAIALVHDDRDTGLDLLLGDARVDRLRVVGPRARLREIERRAHQRTARDRQAASNSAIEAGTRAGGESLARSRAVELHERRASASPTASTAGESHASIASARKVARFGAGLDVRHGPELDLTALCNASYLVARDADPALAAREVVERAFGRVWALSGQRPGSIGRVLCHERSFSRFSAELLLEIERHPDASRPLAAREAATLDHLRRAHELGLDEGATLVYSRAEAPARSGAARTDASSRSSATESSSASTRASSQAASAASAPSRGSAPDLSREPRAEAMLWPAVFTNVEEHMRIAWLGRPAPILCLMRVASDESGGALARAIERDPVAEDLSDRAESAGETSR